MLTQSYLQDYAIVASTNVNALKLTSISIKKKASYKIMLLKLTSISSY